MRVQVAECSKYEASRTCALDRRVLRELALDEDPALERAGTPGLLNVADDQLRNGMSVQHKPKRFRLRGPGNILRDPSVVNIE